MANTIRLLQIGDMHLPEWPTDLTPIDDKDKNFSEEIKQDLRANKLRAILKKINDLSASGDIDAIVCVGDFTSRGITTDIAKAIEIIHFLTTDRYAEKPILKFAVPGNHDVSRADARANGPLGKFSPLEEALTLFGWPAPPVEDCRVYPVSGKASGTVNIHLLNSSLGSWSTHLLPEPIAQELEDDKIGNAPIRLFTDSTDAKLMVVDSKQPIFASREHQVYDQLDTPYVSMKALSTLKSILDESDRDCALIVAHHNLLSQTTPRITPYSELLNAGQFRRHLHNTGKSIIYLHGHIHSDPVERISEVLAHTNDNLETQIITVSAPVIWEGFNEVCLFLDDAGEVFLARVTQYRPDELGNVGNFSDQASKYVPIKSKIAQLMTKTVQKTWATIRHHRVLSWNDAMQLAKESSISEDELHQSVLSLFCCGLLHVGHLGRDKSRWRITMGEAA